MRRSPDGRDGFTLIELLVVITMIGILAGLLFPAFQAVQNQAKRVQAKNDLTQIVNAVNAFYTEYGQYPLATADTTYGSTTIPNADLFYTLRAVNAGTANANNAANPRIVVFLSVPDVKDPAKPRSGIATQNATVNGVSIQAGEFVDPWGTKYKVRIDGGYDNQLANPYSLSAGAATLQIGVIAWSNGKDTQSQSLPGPAADKGTGINADDIVSWQ